MVREEDILLRFCLLNTHSEGMQVNEEAGSTAILLSLVIYIWELAAT